MIDKQNQKTLILLDAHAMIHRAFHALPKEMATQDGTPTGAVYGFFLMLQKIVLDFKPTHLLICFDTPKPTFRKKLYKGYQAKRPKMDDTLKTQIPLIKDLIDESGLKRIEKPGFEADDVIGTAAENLKDKVDRVLIVTGDRDLLQLTDDKVYLIAPKRGITHFDLFTPDTVIKKYGVTPEHIPDFKSLAGDSSDNYNTAKGIGPKTAKNLLSNYPNVEDLLENVDSVKNDRFREILKRNKEKILLFKKIATIVTDLDINPPLSSIAFSGFKKDMEDDLKKLELFSLVPKLLNTPSVSKTPEKKESKSEKSDQISLF